MYIICSICLNLTDIRIDFQYCQDCSIFSRVINKIVTISIQINKKMKEKVKTFSRPARFYYPYLWHGFKISIKIMTKKKCFLHSWTRSSETECRKSDQFPTLKIQKFDSWAFCSWVIVDNGIQTDTQNDRKHIMVENYFFNIF